MKNSFAPINKIPSDVFSLIPGYWEDNDELDENLITMTHVCRGWRELLIARPSLWDRLGCTNTNKTRVYIERSKSSPLELSLYKHGDATYLDDAFILVVPHITRLKSLNVEGTGTLLQSLAPYLSCPTPLLGELTIELVCHPTPLLDHTLHQQDCKQLISDGNLSSLFVTYLALFRGFSRHNFSRFVT